MGVVSYSLHAEMKRDTLEAKSGVLADRHYEATTARRGVTKPKRNSSLELGL